MAELRKSRKLGPDLLKIAATVFVIIIHHKNYTDDPVFIKQRILLISVLFAVSLCFGTVLWLKSKEKNKLYFFIPVACLVAILVFRLFAVVIFLLVTGYLMSSSLGKYESDFGKWYSFSNLFPRIARFYIPLFPIFVICIIYKIIVKNYDYTALEVIVRFFLGGFKPGSYYITILAELVFLCPLIYLVVKRFRRCGVIAVILVNLAYDFFCAFLGMNDILYKFLAFRFLTHIALGIYGGISEFKRDKAFNICVFIIGALYTCLVYIGHYKPFMFFQWEETSFPIALMMYPVIMLFIEKTKRLGYTDTRLSEFTLDFANSTYHIFLVQLMYYTTFGFDMNRAVYNIAITLPLNLLVILPLGILYYKIISPLENRITKNNK